MEQFLYVFKNILEDIKKAPSGKKGAFK